MEARLLLYFAEENKGRIHIGNVSLSISDRDFVERLLKGGLLLVEVFRIVKNHVLTH